MRNFDTGRSRVKDQITRFTDPNYGRDAFMSMVGEAAPTVDSFLARQAANGGSSQMAREQAQSARQQAFGQGLQSLNQMQRGAQQTAAQLSQGLMQDDLQRKQLAFKRRQANKGGGLAGILGQIAGTGLGALAGGVGASVGGSVGKQLGNMLGESSGSDNSSGPGSPPGNFPDQNGPTLLG